MEIGVVEYKVEQATFYSENVVLVLIFDIIERN